MTDDEMTNTLAVPEEAALAAAAQEDTDDPSMRAKIELPCWDRLNDSKIIREVSEVFKGFELPNEEACSKQFADADALAESTLCTTAAPAVPRYITGSLAA